MTLLLKTKIEYTEEDIKLAEELAKAPEKNYMLDRDGKVYQDYRLMAYFLHEYVEREIKDDEPMYVGGSLPKSLVFKDGRVVDTIVWNGVPHHFSYDQTILP